MSQTTTSCVRYSCNYIDNKCSTVKLEGSTLQWYMDGPYNKARRNRQLVLHNPVLNPACIVFNDAPSTDARTHVNNRHKHLRPVSKPN